MLCNDNNILLILIFFAQLLSIIETFSKHDSKLLGLNEQRFQSSSQKHLNRGDCQY